MNDTAAHCCGIKAMTIDSRPNHENGSWRRRRKCAKCNRRWTTIEILHPSLIPGVDPDLICGRLRRMSEEIAALLAYIECVSRYGKAEVPILDEAASNGAGGHA